MNFFDVMLPPHPHKGIESKDFNTMEDMYQIQLEDELLGVDWLQCFATHTLDTKYKFTATKDAIDQ
jgi:hypothetical protein